MAYRSTDQLLQMESKCGSLLVELQMIWDEVGVSDMDRDKIILELEQECMEIYRRKVDQANHSRAQLRQAIADGVAELASICSALGEPPVHTKQSKSNAGSLKEELMSITPLLEDMRKRKSERRSRFEEVLMQIQKISNEIKPEEYRSLKLGVDESDLSTKRLEELQKQLQLLQKEKSDRLKKVLEYVSAIKSLCLVLGIDFKQTISEVHPSLDGSETSKNISNSVIERLASSIQKLRELKIQRMKKLQDLATSMLELWNLMDTPLEEQQLFQTVTCNIAASEHEITEPDTLSIDFINYVEAEVSRLDQLKSSKMKELVFKKKMELEELRRRTHLIENTDTEIETVIESGAVDPQLILEQIEAQISEVKEESYLRKDILDRVEKWLLACNEESWLEEYNRDENRYSATRGAHLALKRAEKARAVVNKIPATMEVLTSKTIAWENERGIEFTYDGIRLLSMLEEYAFVRQSKEQERMRQRDQKKLEIQRIAEQEALFGSKPSPCKPQSAKKMPRNSTGGQNRRLSLGTGAIMQSPKIDISNSIRPITSAKKADERSVLSPAKGGLDVAELTARKLSYNNNTGTGEAVTPRTPFTPIKTANYIPVTPSKPTQSIYNEEVVESQTPQTVMSTPVPKTPKTVLPSMQLANTPAPKSAVSANETEYSFEERRLAYYLTRQT